MKLRFQTKLFLYLAIFNTAIFITQGVWQYTRLNDKLYKDTAIRTHKEAEYIAQLSALKRDILNRDTTAIKRLLSPLAASSDASFIVVGDAHAKHLYHSRDEKLIGTPLVGNDNARVLEGYQITTVRHGTLGMSLRSKVPVLYQGRVIGIVSVGYLKSYLNDASAQNIVHISLSLLLLLCCLYLFSWCFTRHIKKQIFFLEPREIGVLVRQQKAMMEAMYEGVIVIDDCGRIQLINRAAKVWLNLPQKNRLLRGKPITSVIHPITFFEPQVMLNQDTHDEVAVFNKLTVIANRVRIMLENKLQGWVISFRDSNDISSLNDQLSQVKSHINDLRIVRHEYRNQLSTLTGLLSLGHVDEALSFIQAQSQHTQQVLDFISTRFCSPLICGLLLGKYSRACEKGIILLFDAGCWLKTMPESLSDSEFISVIGNVLDNAIEATLRAPSPQMPIEILIRQNAEEILIEVADQGIGIADSLKSTLFEPGITSKTEGDHGLGLHLISTYIKRVGGVIEVTDNVPNGTIFSLYIPASTVGLSEEKCNAV
ncbi:two-component system, CitB family, cit operon sensor histidine kinase CitA [Izhakiella capsodis]|uniref:histidine kinase n=1 Tax=Izhakiella capsodis TaxID=1367852 RepID=A0A1I4V7N4_9GAMM|nr:sensor histidine kinase [Izhakiella capsodis]SFM97226.1 two-component system, CitB family, cit operon sensor histidine kinase CitA [Izhakiella capsodis]